jgi:hypothetical protein
MFFSAPLKLRDNVLAASIALWAIAWETGAALHVITATVSATFQFRFTCVSISLLRHH